MLIYLDNLDNYAITPWGDYDLVTPKPGKTTFDQYEEKITSALVHRTTNRVACLGLPRGHEDFNNPNIVYRSVAGGDISFRSQGTMERLDPLSQANVLEAFPLLGETNFLYNHTTVLRKESHTWKVIALIYLSMGTMEPPEEVQTVIETFLEYDDV